MATIFVRNLLSTELTSAPTWIRTIFKEHYNNTLCNGATWVLVLWKVLHILYDRLMYCYLKRIGTKHYIGARVTHSLWYCGFFCSTLAYCLLTFEGNKMDLLRGSHMIPNENLPTQVILAHTVICTFYLHTALLEGLQGGSLHLFLKYVLLVTVCTSAYILKFLTVPLTLSALIGISTISEELTKIFYSLLNEDKFVGGLYVFNLVLFIFVHLMIIPLILLIPMGKLIALNTDDSILILLFTSLVFWLCFAIYHSIITNSIFHWIYHTSEEPEERSQEEKQEDSEEIKRIVIQCPGNMIECSLFSGRTDDAYILYILRSQMNERKIEMDAKKKPKSKNLMLIQTIKCMMAIRKKLNQKRKSESSESEEHSENEIEEDGEDDKVLIDEPFDVEGGPILQADELEKEKDDIMVIEESEMLIATIDMENASNVEPDETINDSSEQNVAFESLSHSEHSETKVDISDSTKDLAENQNDIVYKPKSVENFESCSNLALGAEKVIDSKISSDLACGARNLGNIESGNLPPEAESKPTKIVSDILDDIVDNKLNIETELKESIKADEKALLFDEEYIKKGEVNEGQVRFSASYRARADDGDD